MSNRVLRINKEKRDETAETMATIGTIIDEHALRDAIHVAVEPAKAAHILRPGDHVGKLGSGAFGSSSKPVGIVDPFLTSAVETGQWFWLFVYPRTITSLRHEWTHPELDPSPEPHVLNEHEQWLRDYAHSVGVSYEGLLEHALEYVVNETFWCEGERFEGEFVPEAFWDHYDAIVGVVTARVARGNFFSCSC